MIEFLDRSDLSPQARQAIGQRLSNLPQFAELTSQAVPGPRADASLFDFSKPQVKTRTQVEAAALQKLTPDERRNVLFPSLIEDEPLTIEVATGKDGLSKGSVFQKDPETGKVTILQTPKEAEGSVEAQRKQADRLLELLDRPDVSPSGKKAIEQQLLNLPQFAGVAGQLPQDGASLFDFAEQKLTTTGTPREGTVFQTDPETGKITIIQQPDTLSPKERVFEDELTTEQQIEVVLGAGKGQTINVNVDTGEAEVPLTSAVETDVQKDVIEISDQIKEIVDLGDQFEDQFLTVPGRLRAGTAAAAEKFLTIPPAKTEAFLEKIGVVDKADEDLLKRRTEFLLPAYTILNERIKEITGAAVREGEEGRLGQSTVDPTKDGPTQFKAKRATVEAILRRQKKEKLILLSRGIAYNAENVNEIAWTPSLRARFLASR